MKTEMLMSDQGVANLIKWEGSMTHKYRDSAGLWTIGVGHLLTKSELASGELLIGPLWIITPYGKGISDDTVAALLRQDLDDAETAVTARVKIKLEQFQYDVLVSFTFNVGVRAFATSTLLKCINSGEFNDVPFQLKRWNRSGGRVVQGLINRRLKEVGVWETGYV
tara:strand:+ start:855 stop:1352 length:498 start_codon:yes stop_codon:yes gene_type:complete